MIGQDEVNNEWNIDDDRASYTAFSYLASEGSWISLDISPDGEHMVIDLLGHIYQMPVTGGTAVALTEGRSWNMFPRYSPDGTKLLFTSDKSGSEDLWVMDLENNENQNVSKMDIPVFQGTWSKDGRHVYGTALNMKVRFPAYQFNLFGSNQELIPAAGREPVNYFTHHPTEDVLYFEHNQSGNLYTSGGPRIKKYDLITGETSSYIQRPGGAASPTISPDGKWLVYLGKDDKETIVVLHELSSRQEKVLYRGLDWGRFESRGFYGCYSNIDWHPDGREIFLSHGGGIHTINVETGNSRQIPFEALVQRKLDNTHRAKVDFPTDGRSTTRTHRWGTKTPDGTIFEVLGDLYRHTGNAIEQLTSTIDHETHPVYDPGSNTLFYARWNDQSLGSLQALNLENMTESVISDKPSQYGQVAVSGKDGSIVFIRGAGGIIDGQRLEDQTKFELVWSDKKGEERKITEITWIGNRYAKRPPTVIWGPDAEFVFFTEYEGDALTMKKIDLNGHRERVLYEFSNATRAVVSPDFRWIFFREYHRSFVTPYDYSGKKIVISAADKKGLTIRVDAHDGDFTEWSEDGQSLYWTRGKYFIEKALVDILDENDAITKTDLSVEYDVHIPSTVIALQNVRVLTMNEEDEVLENVTVLIENQRITQIGKEIQPPDNAKIYDLTGHTVMPGMFDAHGHYGSPISALNVIEEGLYGLHANLAYGVTTMYDVYGTTQKDFWVDDMLRSGKITGPRIFSVGDPVFVTKYRTKMHRPIHSLDDAREIALFNKDHGATALKDYSNHTRKARQFLMEACRERNLNLITESFGNPQMNLTQIVDGFTGIEHTLGLTPIYDDIIQLFAATKIGMTPTLIVVYNGVSGENYFYQREKIWEDEKLLNFYSKEQLIRHKRPTHYFEDDFYHKQMAAEMLKLHRAGVLLQMGAHGQKMGIGAHWEMEMFVHGGFTPYEAIKIATINGFKHHGLDHELGSIETMKLADLVILEKNPLIDIRNTRTIKYVMKNGVLYSGFDASQVYPIEKKAEKMYFK